MAASNQVRAGRGGAQVILHPGAPLPVTLDIEGAAVVIVAPRGGHPVLGVLVLLGVAFPAAASRSQQAAERSPVLQEPGHPPLPGGGEQRLGGSVQVQVQVHNRLFFPPASQRLRGKIPELQSPVSMEKLVMWLYFRATSGTPALRVSALSAAEPMPKAGRRQTAPGRPGLEEEELSTAVAPARCRPPTSSCRKGWRWWWLPDRGGAGEEPVLGRTASGTPIRQKS